MRARSRRRHHGGQRADQGVVRVPAQGRSAGRRRPARILIMISTTSPVRLIEDSPIKACSSRSWSGTARIVRLAAHLARLDRSCRELYGLGLPDDLAGRIVAAVSRQPPGARLAIRLQAHPEQGAAADHHRLRPLGPRLETSSLRRMPRVERSWRHKWVDRASLEAGRAGRPVRRCPTSLPRPAGVDHRDVPRQPVPGAGRWRLVHTAAGRAGASRGHPPGGDRHP